MLWPSMRNNCCLDHAYVCTKHFAHFSPSNATRRSRDPGLHCPINMPKSRAGTQASFGITPWQQKKKQKAFNAYSSGEPSAYCEVVIPVVRHRRDACMTPLGWSSMRATTCIYEHWNMRYFRLHRVPSQGSSLPDTEPAAGVAEPAANVKRRRTHAEPPATDGAAACRGDDAGFDSDLDQPVSDAAPSAVPHIDGAADIAILAPCGTFIGSQHGA